MARPSVRRIDAARADRQRQVVLKTLTAAGVPGDVAGRVATSDARSLFTEPATLAGSAAVFKGGNTSPETDRNQIAQWWQTECYRHVNICGEARYAAVLYSNVAGRAELGVSEAQSLARKPVWVNEGPEVDVLAEVAPTVRDRTSLIRTFMLHWVIAGECYLIARERRDTDPPGPNPMIWEVVAVTELRKVGTGNGSTWQVRHDNGHYIDLHPNDPIIRMWNPDPSNRREAWSPMKALLPTLREIEWLTRHIFTQVRSRLLGAGVWFLPNNLTFAPPSPDSVEGGEDAIAAMNEAEKFMVSLADSSMDLLESDEVGFPSIVMGDPIALANVDQKKLIQFWSNIDKAAMELRSDAIRRFALGMDLPSGKAIDPVTVASGENGGSGGANHWGKWAEQQEMITEHIEPALDALTSNLTSALLWVVVDTDRVIAYDSARMRLQQDLSKPAMEWYDRGELKASVALREGGFDPEADMPDEAEFRRWALKKLLAGNPTPEMMSAAAEMLRVTGPGEALPIAGPGDTRSQDGPAPQGEAPTLGDHPYQGPPREQHDHSPAPYRANKGVMTPEMASAEALVLRALEKAGNRLLNEGKRGRERPVGVQPFAAHVTEYTYDPENPVSFDFTTAALVFDHLDPRAVGLITRHLALFCADLYSNHRPYTRADLIAHMRSL